MQKKPIPGFKYVLNQKKVGKGGFKSPFLKGGFRGIIKRLFNPPCPPLEKGGIFPLFKLIWIIQNGTEKKVLK